MQRYTIAECLEIIHSIMKMNADLQMDYMYLTLYNIHDLTSYHNENGGKCFNLQNCEQALKDFNFFSNFKLYFILQ